MTENPADSRDAGSPHTWPVYDPDVRHDGVNDVSPPPPPRHPRRLLIAISAVSLVVAAAGVGSIVLRSRATTTRQVSPTSVRTPVVTGPQWTNAAPSLTRGLVRVQVTANVEADGIIMTKDGLVATSYARMVGLNGSDLDISKVELNVIADGGLPMRAKLIGFDATKDVAVLRVDGFTPSATAKLGSPAKPKEALTLLDDLGEGQPVWGHPVSVQATNQPCSREGAAMLSRPRGFQFSIDSSEAEPGGAVVRDDGTVVGMYYGGDTDRKCAVPIADVAAVVNNVKRGHQTATTRVGPAGGLGIQLLASDDGYPTVYSIENPGDLANAAGVQRDDVLTRVGNTSLRDADLTTLGPSGVISTLEPGQTVTIEWRSHGTTHRATVKVGIGAEPRG